MTHAKPNPRKLPSAHRSNLRAADYCPELAGILPRETAEEKKLFELLDYVYIGARYDMR